MCPVFRDTAGVDIGVPVRLQIFSDIALIIIYQLTL